MPLEKILHVKNAREIIAVIPEHKEIILPVLNDEVSELFDSRKSNRFY